MAETFGERLQQMRKRNNLTLDELAKKIDSTKSYVWELENKPNIRPSAVLVYKLTNVLNTTVDVLLGKKSIDDIEEKDKVFFSRYQPLERKTKDRLARIMDVLIVEEEEEKMKPVKAAIQITKLWRSICSNGQHYPVDCRMLAEALNIKVHGEPIDDNFEAQLRIRGKHRVIIYNENIREEGRKNFCIAHEIGHHSCHSNQGELSCTHSDLNDMATNLHNIEQEANMFAANLLMPADDFRKQTGGKTATLSLVSNLAENRYKTSLTATCLRLIELSPTIPLGMAVVRNRKIVWWGKTDEMRWSGFSFKKGHLVPEQAIFDDKAGQPVDSSLWLNEKNAERWKLFQSAINMPYYEQTLILIHAERTEEYSKDWEEPDPTPPSIPNF